MCSLLRFKKARRKLIANSRGFSSIVGAVFAVLVMFSLISTVFVWSLSQNTLYNNTVTQTRQADLDRSNEKIVANVTVSRVDNNNVAVNGNLSNDGPLSAQIVTLWVVDANPTTLQTTYAFKSPLSITLKTGNVTTLSGSTAITVPLANSPGDSLSCWFVSGRGNTIFKNPFFAANTVYWNANVTQGIGSISMDFAKFNHYDFGGPPAPGTSIASYLSPSNYTISQGMNTLFHVVLTDMDPLGQNITLDGNSSIYIIGQNNGNTVKFLTANLVNVTLGKIYLSSPAAYTLPLSMPLDIYFYGSTATLGNLADGHIYPVNIMLFGQKGGSDYGQNIPFISIYVRT